MRYKEKLVSQYWTIVHRELEDPDLVKVCIIEDLNKGKMLLHKESITPYEFDMYWDMSHKELELRLACLVFLIGNDLICKSLV